MSKQINDISNFTPNLANANLGTERGSIQLEDYLRNYGAAHTPRAGSAKA